MASMKFSVRRCLATLSFGFRGKYSNVKYCSVDLPLSNNAFSSFFADDYTNEDNFKRNVSVKHLNAVFGSNWHIYNFPNSSTRRRIIGDVHLHYRMKKISGWTAEHLAR